MGKGPQCDEGVGITHWGNEKKKYFFMHTQVHLSRNMHTDTSDLPVSCVIKV